MAGVVAQANREAGLTAAATAAAAAAAAAAAGERGERQRVIWGYKILFLDVLFPLELQVRRC